MPKRTGRHDPHDLVAEIVRRAGHAGDAPSYVVYVSDPPTPFERLQLLSVRLQRRPVAIMPQPCRSMDEWHARYGHLFGP